MKTVALIPIKYDSARLPLKNFKLLAPDGPRLWEYTYNLVHNHPKIDRCYITCDDKGHAEIWNKFNPDDLYVEEVHYKRGKTLGATIANFIKYFVIENPSKQYFNGDEYILVSQCDVFPKYASDIDRMIDFAARNPDIDYIVSGTDGIQNGAFRLIKIPLNQEVLGQTIGMVNLPGDRVDIHYESDFVEAQEIFKLINRVKDSVVGMC